MNENPIIYSPEKEFHTGKYVFTGSPVPRIGTNSPVPVLWADALRIYQPDKFPVGDSGQFPLSDLILKASVFVEQGGKKVEAHKLYTWPRNLGSTADWTKAKTEFLLEFVLNYPLEILDVHAEQGLTWTFITPENFKKLPDELHPEGEFITFYREPETYFFLRKPVNLPL